MERISGTEKKQRQKERKVEQMRKILIFFVVDGVPPRTPPLSGFDIFHAELTQPSVLPVVIHEVPFA